MNKLTIDPKKYSKHLRVREENIIGGTRYIGLCGAAGITSRDYAKSLLQVTCKACRSKIQMKGKSK